jgi:hypothetical protein
LVLPWPASTTGVASKPERADPSASEAAREPGSDAQSRPLEKKRDAAYSAFSDQNFHKVYAIREDRARAFQKEKTSCQGGTYGRAANVGRDFSISFQKRKEIRSFHDIEHNCR